MEGDNLVGQRIDGYEIIGVLSQGGMGVVYRARQVALDRLVAFKVILDATDEDLVKRFRRETSIHAHLAHPNLVKVFGAGVHQNQAYLVMELVDGPTLKEVIVRSAPLSLGFILSAMGSIAGGVAYLHSRKILHRDLKPANILISREGAIKVTDFGLARGDQTHS